MKRFAMVLALICALSASTFAGNMPTGGKAEEPTPPTTTSSTASTSGALLVSLVLTILSLK